MKFNEEKLLAFKLALGGNQWDDSLVRVNARGGKFGPVLNINQKNWNEISKTAAEYGFNIATIPVADALKYKSHPEIAKEGAWEISKLKEELHRLRELGITPVPDLNFSAGHDAWMGEYSRMLSTPIYYEVVRDLIWELIEIFDNPEYFVSALDEEGPLIQRRMDFVCYRQHDLFWHDMRFIIDCIREKGARPWMACDSFVHHPEEFQKHIPKDVIVSPWYYGNYYEDASRPLPKSFGDPVTDPDNYSAFMLGKIHSYTKLPECGYDIMPICSNTSNDFGINHAIRYTLENCPMDKLLGIAIHPAWSIAEEYVFYDAFEQTTDTLNKYYK